MTGYTISPLAFIMAMKVIIRASKWVVGGERLPPLRAYIDDVTLLTPTIKCSKKLLNKLHSNITWAGMEFKASKSRSISIIKGKLTPHRFHIKEVPIALISEKSIKSLRRWFNECFKDSEEYGKFKGFTILNSIDKTLLPGK